MKYISLLCIVFLLSLNFSLAEALSPLDHDIYRYNEEDSHLARSVVSIFNKHTSARGTAFFISPNRLMTVFHVVCCFKSPVNETLFISTEEGLKIPVDRILYADAYNDWAILEVDHFSSDFFLNLNKNKEDTVQIQDDIYGFGYVKGYPGINYFKGKITSKNSDTYASTINFYQLKGMSGAPFLYEKNNTVVGMLFAVSSNIASIKPVWEMNEVIAKQKFCLDLQSCQSTAIDRLITQAEGENPQAQYMLGLLYIKLGAYLIITEEKFGLEHLLWWSRAAEAGYTEAMVNFGAILMSIGNRKNIKEGFQLIQKASEKGNIVASYLLGELFTGMFSQKENALSKSEKYFTLAASRGHIWAQLRLGQFYQRRYEESSTDEEKNIYKEKALYWYRKAGKNGYFEVAGLMLQMLTAE